MGRGVLIASKRNKSLPSPFQIYPPANPKYISGSYSCSVSIWYRDTWGEYSTFEIVIDMKKYKSGYLYTDFYASHGSGGTPYVRLDVLNANSTVKRNIYYSTRNGLNERWYDNVHFNESDIIDGKVRIRGTAFGCVYSPDNPSWCVREITVQSVNLTK